ncbi:MAG: SDR family oxidoreductase [Pseudomonadota bacterium]
MDLVGKRVLLTGGGSGLGAVIARRMADAGMALALSYASDRTRADATARAVQANGAEALVLHLDQSDPVSVERGVAEAADALGGLDILINNAGRAGGPPPGDLEAMTATEWDAQMLVNLRGPFLVSRAAAPVLRDAAPGRIINIGSVVGFGAAESQAAFTVSKASVIPLTRYLASCLAPDVLVNCVAPGLMQGTAMSGGASDAYVAEWKSRALLNRTTAIEDVASQVLTLCATGSMTGQTVLVDGGLHFH